MIKKVLGLVNGFKRSLLAGVEWELAMAKLAALSPKPFNPWAYKKVRDACIHLASVLSFDLAWNGHKLTADTLAASINALAEEIIARHRAPSPKGGSA